MKLLPIACALMLTGCAGAMGKWNEVDPGPKPDQAEAEKMAEARIRSTLKDPDAGQFKDWSPLYKSYGGMLANEPVWAVCVDVNGKNSYGGYSGFKPTQVYFYNGKPGTAPADAAEAPYGCRSMAEDPTRR